LDVDVEIVQNLTSLINTISIIKQKMDVLLSRAALSAIPHKVSQFSTFALLREGSMGPSAGSHCQQSS